MIYIVTAIYVTIAVIQVRELLKQKKKAESAVCLVLMLIALVYTYDEMLELQLPNPSMVLDLLFGKTAQWVFGIGGK